MGFNRSAIKLYFTGMVGGIIQYEVRGMLRVRSRPESVRNPRTAAQTEHRTRFALASSYVRSLGDVYKVGYREYNKSISQRANIVKQVYGEALTRDGLIDPLKVRTARGPLTRPQGVVVEREENGVKVSWFRPTNHGLKLTMTVYNYTRAVGQTHYDVATSQATNTTVAVPSEWQGDALYVYAFWRNEKSGSASDSTVVAVTEGEDSALSLLDSVNATTNRQSLTARWPSAMTQNDGFVGISVAAGPPGVP